MHQKDTQPLLLLVCQPAGAGRPAIAIAGGVAVPYHTAQRSPELESPPMAPRDSQPTWQPISQLPTVAWALTGMAGEAAGMLGSLRKAASKHRALDDDAMERVIRLYTEQQDDLWLYEEQLRRWHERRLTISQRQEVADLRQRLGRLRADLAAIFELATYLRPRVIDALLSPPTTATPSSTPRP